MCCSNTIIGCHKGACSTAPVTQNEFPLTFAIANQKQEEVEQGYSASLLVENSVLGVDVKAVDEGVRAASRREGSAAPAPSTEKWSHEAIVARSNMRPERMQKLKVASNSGQNLGFDFLQECWNDDPVLVIAIKKLLAKFPQWGLVAVDGLLVRWNE